MSTRHRLSIAPMMAYTDRHFRFLARLFTKRTLLFTEMVVGSTITHNANSCLLDRVLGFDPVEHPLAVQLGGDDPRLLKQAARICEDYGYDEINLNVGCPSDRVQRGRFGACLMKEPEQVADLFAAVRDSVAIPVSVKHRIGVDQLDRYQDMERFVELLSQVDCRIFIVHARKAWLRGLSPAQNRSIPPLRYDLVYRLKREKPQLTIVINGGIQNLDETLDHLTRVDGAMIGRAAYYQPEGLAEADHLVFGAPPSKPKQPLEILAAMDSYAHHQIEAGSRLSFTVKHLVGLFKGQPGARLWRQRITKLIQNNPDSFNLPELYRQAFGNNWL